MMKENTFSQPKNFGDRLIWPDIIRIVAVFLMIILHAAAAGFDGRFAVTSSQYQSCNLYNSMVRCCVPLFVMISGAFLLNPKRDYTIKKLLLVKVLRMGTAYVIWATFYAVIRQWHLSHAISVKGMFYALYAGHYHMWFLFMISGLYIVTPILRLIAKDEKMLRYFLALAFVIVFFANTLSIAPPLRMLVASMSKRLDINLVLGYSSYFLLGFWLVNRKLEKKTRQFIYLIGTLSVFGTIALNGIASVYVNRPGTWFYGNLLPNTLFYSIAMFTFCQYHFANVSLSGRWSYTISLTAQLSFGVYLIHSFFLEHLRIIGLPDFFIHPILSIPVTATITFVFSLATIYVLNKIPVLNKYAM